MPELTSLTGDVVLETVLDEENEDVEPTVVCERCEEEVSASHSHYVEDRFGYCDVDLCDSCFEQEENEEENEEDEITPLVVNNVDTDDCPKFETQEIIDSVDKSITFGLEFEVVEGKGNSLKEYARSIGYNYTHDGSLQGRNPIEFQTSVLKGKKGVLSVLDFLSKANELEHKVNDTCGTHVHLGALDFFDEFKFNLSNLKESNGMEKLVIERVLLLNILESIGEESVKEWLNDMYMRGQSNNGYSNTYRMKNGKISRYSVVKIYLLSEAGRYNNYNYVIRDSQLEKLDCTTDDIVSGNKVLLCGINKDRDNRSNEIFIKAEDISIYARPRSEKYQKLKTLFYTYTLFEKLIFAMLPENRKENNYCNPLATSYSLRDIGRCQSQNDIEKLWYKKTTHTEVARSKQNHYDESRYHSFNLHAMFYKYGTVEIRSHHGTLQAQSILMWVAFHQAMLTAVLKGHFNFVHNYNHRASLRTVADYYKLLVKVLGIEGTPLQKFIKYRIDKYSPKSLLEIK